MDGNASEGIKALHKWGFNTRSDPTLPWASVSSPAEGVRPLPGRADVIAGRGGRSVAIEFKCGDKGFDLTKWTEEQRHWASMWCRPQPFGIEYWVFLSIGPDMPHLSPEKHQPRKSWLVSFPAMTAVDGIVRPIQNTLPYLAGKGYNAQLQALQLDAIHLLKPYELQWFESRWALPRTHLFYKMYIEPEPLPLSDNFGEVNPPCPTLQPQQLNKEIPLSFSIQLSPKSAYLELSL